MNLSFFIARRYFASKKSTNFINIISGISVIGVVVGTAALIIVLSVFNGFEGLARVLDVHLIEPRPQREDFTRLDLDIRRLALKNFRALGYPAIAFTTSDDATMQAVEASTFVAKYAAVVVTDAGVTYAGANVIATDVEACNGVIHVIDAVLVPPAA